MAMNPIQFQPGMSLTELFEHYGTEEQCEQALEQARLTSAIIPRQHVYSDFTEKFIKG